MTEWLITFLLHSTLWCGLAWLSLRLRQKTDAQLREMVWHTAIAASLLTPAVQTFTSPEAAFWRVPLPVLATSSEGGHSERERGHKRALASASADGEERHGEELAATNAWRGFANGAWLTIAAGLVLYYLVRLERLRRRLRRRETVQDTRASCALEALSRNAGLSSVPRLTESDNLGSPVALGIGASRGICLPVRALHDLDEDELTALLGHEVAHHLRRDTIRLGVLNTLQAVFFFQPLFRIALREVRFAAEEQCDDWAASQLDDRFAMASCLTEVAGWVVREDRSIPVPCMGQRRSQIEVRVRRLMDEHSSLRTPSRVWRGLGSAGLLVVTSWLAPSIAPVTEASHSERGSVEHGESQEHEWQEHSRPPVERHERGEHEGRRREHGG